MKNASGKMCVPKMLMRLFFAFVCLRVLFLFGYLLLFAGLWRWRDPSAYSFTLGTQIKVIK